MTVQTLEAEPTQTTDERSRSLLAALMASRSPLAGLIMLASLGLIPPLVSAPGPVLTYSTASESTYTVSATTASDEFARLTNALSRIHDTLLSEAKELDAAARQVLSQHLWDLYIS